MWREPSTMRTQNLAPEVAATQTPHLRRNQAFDGQTLCSSLFTVTQTDYDGVLTDEELEETRLSFAKGELNTSEWEYVKGICPSTTV